MSKERNPDMDHYSDLNEDQKSFLDDLRDEQIRNIANRYFHHGSEQLILMNKHNRTMGFKDTQAVQRYCRWLIDVEAVKYVKNPDVLLSSNPAS